MDASVSTEVMPLTKEDKDQLFKNMIWSTLIVLLIEGIAGCMLFVFFSDNDFGIFKMIFFGFFLLVGGIIVFGNVSSYFDSQKIVSVGYITEKRSHTRYSSGSRGSSSSSSTDYYFTLGEKEMSVELQYYSQVQKGDKIRMHQTRWNKSIFKIEVLEKHYSAPVSMPANFGPLAMQVKEERMSPEESGILRRKLFILIFYRILLLGGVAVVLYYILLLVLMLSVPSEWLGQLRLLILGVSMALPAIMYLYFNMKTWKVFVDLNEGLKKVATKVVTDVIRNNKPMLGKNIVVSSGSVGDYYYALTHDGSFISLAAGVGGKLQSGDKIEVHESPRSKVVLSVWPL